MAGETTTPLLPCPALDEITRFYEAPGFKTTYRQRRPNGYAVMAREDLVLHFSSIDGFVPSPNWHSAWATARAELERAGDVRQALDDAG